MGLRGWHFRCCIAPPHSTLAHPDRRYGWKTNILRSLADSKLEQLLKGTASSHRVNDGDRPPSRKVMEVVVFHAVTPRPRGEDSHIRFER